MLTTTKKVFCVLAMLLGASVMLWAQVETGRILGTVTDQSGAVIPGAKITITNLETNLSYETESDAEGHYESLPLRIGTYSVTAEMAGFKRAVRSGIDVRIRANVLVDLALEVGQVTQEVSVTEQAPLLETTQAAQGQVIDNQKMVDLPLNGRNYIELALLSVGANRQPPGARASGFSGSGMRATMNNFVLDGIDNNNNQATMDARQGETVRPSVDAIKEFKVVTNSFSAEYGRALGAVVNVSIKSGSNDVHGTVFGFLRNEAFDAKNFFDKPDEPKPPFKRSQFGFSLGGPIIKDKTFIFGDYEGTRIRESRTVNNTIPTQKMLAGDFSEILPTQIYDPASYNPATKLRAPFPNNVIPSARFDRVSAQAAQWYPAPNKPGLKQNYLYNPPSPDDTDKWDVRVDHTIGPSDNLYGRFSFQRRKDPASPNLPPPAFDGAEMDFQHDGRNFVIGYNHIFTPTLINSLKVGWNRIYTDRQAPIDYNYNAQLGIPGVNTFDRGGAQFNISTVTNLGTGPYNPDPADSQTRQLVNDTTWIHGKHTVKFGANLNWLQAFNNNAQQSPGVFYFNGSFTRDSKTKKQGSPIADFLLGDAWSAAVSNFCYFNWRAPYYGFYVQDEWRVTSRLTLSLGVRYEVRPPWVETRNRIVNFDIDTDPANPKLVAARDGSRYSRATLNTDKNNFGPRFGFAYRATDSTVIRGGYGVYYTTYEAFGDGRSISANPPVFYRSRIYTDRVHPTLPLREGFPAGLLTAEHVTDLVLITQDRHGRLPYAQQWSFSIQRELPGDMLFEIGYYGNVARKLMRRTEGNPAPPGPGNVNARRRYQYIEIPPDNVPVTSLSYAVRLQPSVNTNFNSLQMRVEKRLSHGLSLLTSYIWSKTISGGRGQSGAGGTGTMYPQDPMNLRAERALAAEHYPHRFVTSYIYDLPFGRGRTYLSNANPVVDGFLGGWTIAGITTLASGRRVNLTVKGNPSNTGVGGGGADRPNALHDWRLSRDERTLGRYFDTSAFVANDPYTYGNAGRNLLEGPGTVNFDLAVYKYFQITEGLRLQFRAEAFNALNTPQFGVPNAQVGNPNFGSIAGAGRPRNLQFGLKVLF